MNALPDPDPKRPIQEMSLVDMFFILEQRKCKAGDVYFDPILGVSIEISASSYKISFDEQANEYPFPSEYPQE